MSFFRTSILSTASTAINVAAKFIINKLLAVYVGPTGYTVIGQFQNFVAMLSAVATAGVANGVTKLTAELAPDPSAQIRTWSAALKLALLASVGTGVLVAGLSEAISLRLFSTADHAMAVALLGLSIPAVAANIISLAILTGLQEYKAITILSISSTAISLLLVGMGAIGFGLDGALVAVVCSQGAAGLLSFQVVRKRCSLGLGIWRHRLDPLITRGLMAFTLMSLATSICGPVATVYLRDHLISAFGLHQTGLWDAMNRVSGMLMLFIATPINMYLLPKLSGARSRNDIVGEITNACKIGVPVLAASFFSLYFLRSEAVHFLFSEEFAPMENLFGPQLVGDFFRALVYIISVYFLSKALQKHFIFLEISSQLILIGATVVITAGRTSVAAASEAYAFSSFACFILSIFVLLFTKEFSVRCSSAT